MHEAWRLSEPSVLEAIRAKVASAPVVIADGHHRYEVALAFQAEQRACHGSATAAWDAVMTYAVELSPRQLSVAAIHRLIRGLPERFDLLAALSEWFEPAGTVPLDGTTRARMVDAGALGLLTSTAAGVVLLRPRDKTVAAADHDLDSSRLDVALAGLPAHELIYEHDVEALSAAVSASAPSAPSGLSAGVLLRPATVAQIAAVARDGDRMPPKTTFFTPKPATGMVFRRAG